MDSGQLSQISSECPTDPAEFQAELESAYVTLNTNHNLTNKSRLLLKAFLELLGHTAGAWNLINFVNKFDDKVDDMAEYLKTNILLSVRSLGGKTPTWSSPIEGDETYIESLSIHMDPVTRGDQKMLRNATFRRDGGKCAITKVPDRRCPTLSEGQKTMRTECAHILPFSLGDFSQEKPAEVQAAAERFAALHFLFPELSWLLSNNINDEKNALTLMAAIHPDFGELKLALLPQNKEHHYKLLRFGPECSLILDSLIPPDGIIKLECYDSDVPMPDPDLLKAHAIICRVWSSRGMEKEYEEIVSMLELSQFAGNGSTKIPPLASSCLIS